MRNLVLSQLGRFLYFLSVIYSTTVSFGKAAIDIFLDGYIVGIIEDLGISPESSDFAQISYTDLVSII